MATAPQRQAYAITCPACGTRPRRASSSEAAPAPVPNPPSTQPMPEAPQPRSSASRVSPTLSGPTNPRSPRAMASISGARTRWRRMWRSPARRSCQAVPSAFLSSAGSSRIRTATSSGTDIAISAPARANAAAAPPPPPRGRRAVRPRRSRTGCRAPHALHARELSAARHARGEGSHGGHEHGVDGPEGQGEHGQRPQPRAGEEQQPRHGEHGRAAHRVARDDHPAGPEPVGDHSAAQHEQGPRQGTDRHDQAACAGEPACTAAQDRAM